MQIAHKYFSYISHYRLPILFGFFVTLLISVAVFAQEEERIIHIFPTNVVSDNWMKEDGALEQALGSQAIFSDFTRKNASFVIVTTEPTEEEKENALPNETVEEQDGDVEDNNVSEERAPVLENNEVQDISPVEPIPDVTMTEYLLGTSRFFKTQHVRAQEVLDNESENVEEESVEQNGAEESVVSSDSEIVKTEMVEDVTSDENVVDVEEGSDDENDVRVCQVLSTPCYTIDFTGFDIGSILSEHTVKGYSLNLSLGAKPFGEVFTPDKLFVRYYYQGVWHLAGEIQIHSEISNFDNGGHFSFPLPELVSWDALKDFKVEIEFVRHGDIRTEVFLDSVWVDAVYEVESSDEAMPVAPNIIAELAALEDSTRPDILLADEKRIELQATESILGDDLIIRSDMDVYNGLTTARAYVSVTNMSDREESFRFITRTDRQAKVTRVEERIKNVPVAMDTPSYSEVAYFCEGGWELELQGEVEEEQEPPSFEGSFEGEVVNEEVLNNETEESVDDTDDEGAVDSIAVVDESTEDDEEMMVDEEATTTLFVAEGDETSIESQKENIEEEVYATSTYTSDLSKTYSCKATGEIETCNSFNADKTNCIVGNERISVDESTSYESDWREVGLLEVTDGGESAESFFERLLGGGEEEQEPTLLTNILEADADFNVMPRETRYFAVDLSFEIQKAGEFVIDIEGEDADATRSMWWRSAFGYRMPVTLVKNTEGQSELPTLYDVIFTKEQQDFFSYASLDGSDVRFYDPLLRKEVPVRVHTFDYVEQQARFGVELPNDTQGSSTVYAYFGNTYVSSSMRLLAPTLQESLLPYFTIREPQHGIVLSIKSAVQRNTLEVTENEQVAIYTDIEKTIFVDEDSVVKTHGPLFVRPSNEEKGAGVTNLEFREDANLHIQTIALENGSFMYELAKYQEASSTQTIGAMEILPLPAIQVFEPLYSQNIFDQVNYLRSLAGPQFHEFLQALKDFNLGEEVSFSLMYHPQKGKFSRFWNGLFNDRLAEVTEVHLMRDGVIVPEARFEVVYGEEGKWTIHMIEMPRELVPGKYAIVLNVNEIGTTYTDSFEFYWGVLVVNTPQSIYEKDTLTQFHMAALDDKGDTICDAILRLTLSTPSGSSEELRVEPQGTCGANNITDTPDYLAWYRPQELGTYSVTLTHVNLDGEVVHQVTDSFEVRESQSFTIERRGATRIWPKASYIMEIAVTAIADFSGQFVEAVPIDFELVDAGGAETAQWGRAKRLVWDMEISAGETKVFAYEYDAPDISPYIYLLGPAEIRVGDEMRLKETRTWKLASDALGQYVEKFVTITPNTADAWTTIDLSGSPYNIPANAVIEMALINTDYGNELYAGVRHASSTLDRRFLLHEAETTGTGVEGMSGVTVHVTASATSSIQYYADSTSLVTFRILGYWTDGVFVERFDTTDAIATNDAWTNWDLNTYGLTQGDVAEIIMVNNNNGADFLAGVRTDGSSFNRYINIHEPESGGDTYATMFVKATTSTARVEAYSDDYGPGTGTDIDFIVAGYWDSMPTGLTYKESWSDLGGPTSNTTWTDRRLDDVSVPPTGIAEIVFDNNNDTNGAMEIGVRTNGSSLGRVLDLHEAEGAGAGVTPGRMLVTAGSDASSTIEYYTESTTADNFYLAGYWSADNYPPNEPTLYDVPFDNEKTGSSTPSFEFSALDPDGTSDLIYEIQWDDDADVATSPLGDRTSDNESGCSPNCFENTVSGGDTSPFTEGQRIRFTMQTELTTGTTYYWRVRAKDGSGGLYGEWSDILSFTYVEDTDPKGWIQTEDTQFDQSVLSGVETYGANKVRLATTPPSGAMVAYGSDTNTDPHYRTWNGSAWSASSSALSVGGQVSWTVLRASPTRNEYILGAQDTGGDVNVQIYNGSTGTWGNLREMTGQVGNAAYKGFDIQYQSQSGDAVVTYCDGDADPSYLVWNGSAWSATSTIDLAFTQNCEWLSLAASPVSDELIMVARANIVQVNPDYEAQVYDTSSGTWGSSYAGGSGDEAAREGIAIEYEEGGGNAVVAISNGQNNNFAYNYWDGSAWWTGGTVALGDDFEWGQLAQDDGTDNMALCYIDEDDDMGTVFWNGTTNAWGAYFEYDQNGDNGITDTDAHGRPVSCQYETTAGRDGYHIVPYSNTSNAEYNYYNGSAWQYAVNNGASISSVQDSWTVNTTRTGVGSILAVFHDNQNTRYDFSAWDGSSWTTMTTIDDYPSRTTEPWYEPIYLAAQRFQEALGSIRSMIVDFDLVPNRPTWGEVIWNTTEPTGTDVKMQVYYATTTAQCNVLVPDGVLPGNSTGFDKMASPLDLSALSTSTYNMLCIKATLSSTNAQTPTLDDWSLSWERQPYLTQADYRWYANEGAYTPTDPWPLGAIDVNENIQIAASDLPPKPTDVLRLRMSILDTNVALPASEQMFKLQYAQGSACSADLDWYDVAPAGSSTALWRGYENTITSSGWYDDDWSGRVAITVDDAYVDEDLSNFPLFVDLADMSSSFWSSVNSDAGDIRVTLSDGTTEVPREVINASTTAETGELFFRATSISASADTVFYVYFGNSSASDYSPSATYGSENVWTNGYDSVLHMHENPAGTAPQMKDATANSYDGTTGGGFVAGNSVTGLFGNALQFTGGNRYVNYANSSLTSYTYSGWFRTTSFSSGGASNGSGTYFMDRQVGGNPLVSLKAIGGNFAHQYRDNSGGGLGALSGSAVLTDGTWQYVSWGRANGSYVFINVNGNYASSAPSLGTLTPDDPRLGIHQSLTTGAFNGTMDEVHIATVARSQAWQNAEYQNGIGNLVSISGAESLGDGYTLPSTVLTDSDVRESYEEENDSVANPNAIPVNNKGEWDWVLENNGAQAGTNYCFRMINADGTTLNAYTRYPQLITNAVPNVPVNESPFDNIATASTTPWFEFSGTDPEENDLHYEIQVDDDAAFGSPLLDRNSIDHFSEFKNLITTADKSPFTNGQLVRFTPVSGLSNGVTYWWRVRSNDPTGSNEWSEWSSPTSLTINTALSVTTWYQTTFNQFETDLHEGTEATVGNAVALTTGFTSGTTTSPTIFFSWGVQGNAWGSLAWNDTETGSAIQYHLEYNNNGVWELIPDSALSGNALGFGTSPISLLGLDPSVYSEIRIRANLTDLGASPILSDWTLSWGYAVEQPTLITLFDNEKTGTTTPSFTFYSNDPQNDDLIYEFQWSSTPLYTSSTTRSSDAHAGFVNTANGGDTSPFSEGDTIRYTIQSGDVLTNGSTYWFRVRARDPSGGNVWSVWSPSRSFTVDTAITVSTWHQTTNEQFENDTLSSLETSSGNLQITTVSREALIAYAEGLVQTPRYRIWNGVVWGSEKSAQNIGERIYWIQSEASPTRDEYAMVTMGVSGAVTAQIYSASTQTWSDYTTISPSSGNILYRGLDLAYETSSGDLLAVSCNGADAVYRTWDGSSWSATSTIALTFTNNCEWLQLASHPTSNEVILLARANTAETPTDYEALVWNGSSWGNSYRIGTTAAAGYEAMAVEYEEGGDNGVVVVGNGANNNFLAINWNGSSWTGTSTVAIGNDLNKAQLKRDVGSDNLLLSYVDANQDGGFAEWNGSSWTNYGVIDASVNVRTANVISGEYETTTGRDGYVLFAYGDSNTANEHYQTWNRTVLSGEGTISTLGEAPVVVTTRTGDGNVLAVSYDDDATEYDFSYWNGITWSNEEVLEVTSITNTNPRTEPISIVARRYPSFTSGSVVSSPVDFYDGTGPGWDSLSWNDTTPGASDIRYQVEYSTDDGESWSLVPDDVLSGNSTGNTAGPVSLANLSYTTYHLIRLVGNFTCDSGDCPTFSDWTVNWAEGLTVSGTAVQYDLTTPIDSGTVVVAVNGVLQSGKTGTIAGGTWSIPNVTFFPGDVVEVWITGANDENEAVAVASAVGPGNLTGMKLYERHLSIGSSMATTTQNVDLALYDNSVSSNEDIFFDVDASNDLTMCAVSGCDDAGLVIVSGHTYQPDSLNGGNVTTHDIRIDGTLVADGNTLYISGSWDNNATSSIATGNVVFTATSTTETIDSTGAASASFNNVTFGQGSGTATWTLGSLLDINGNSTLSHGTLSMGASSMTIGGNLVLGANATFVKGTGTTTFDGTGIATLTDSHTTKQDLGNLYINGTSKTVRLTTPATTTNLTIATSNTFDVTSNNYAFEIQGDFQNAGTLSAQSGTLYFTATSTGHIINTGPSSFANVVFNGVGGNWAFQNANVTVSRDITIQNGIVTLPTGILSVAGSFTVLGGQFVHNNGTVKMTATVSGKTVTPLDSPFFNLTFFGSGGVWSFGQANATTSNDFRIDIGSVTLPTGILSVTGDFHNESGSFTAGSGTVLLTTTATQKTVKVAGSSFNNLRCNGSSGGGGSWYDTLWQYRIPLFVQETVIDADLTDFPVYVDLQTLGDTFWSNVKSDGGDIRVTANDGTTELPIEIVGFSTSTRSGELYFKASSIASTSNTTFYVYVSNTVATGYASTSTYGSRNVWTNGYDTVLHIQEDPSGTAPQMKDVTSYGHNGTTGDSPASNRSVTGKFGKAFDMGGNTYYLDFANSALVSYTYSMWLKPSSYTNGGTGDGNGTYFTDRVVGSAALASLKAVGGAYTHQYRDNANGGLGGVSGGSIRTDGSWQFVAWGRTFGTNFFVHTDGTTYTSTPSLGALTPEDPRVGNHQGLADSTDFNGVVDEIRVANVARSAAWLKAEHANGSSTASFYATSTSESFVARVFLDTNATVQGNATIESGLVVFPTGTLTLNASFTTESGASFDANGGTVLFSGATTGLTVDPDNSSFATLTFNNALGGWTITSNATTTGNMSLTNANDFTLASGMTLTVLGAFANSIPAQTTWTGSTLNLSSGTNYTVGSKTQAEETYNTLAVGANTDIRLWQSSASTYAVDATGSLYSQDHATVDGNLYIFGAYERTSGTDYWSYNTDFDGVDISGTPRQAAVRFASGASARLSSSTLQILGGATASTTLQNQGSGSFGLSVTGGTLQAQHYTMTNLDASGFSLLGTTTVTMLSDGAYTLTTNGGSMMTIASTTINANPALQVQRLVFATSSGIGSGYNVTATGTATSYWWFRNSSGNYAGESYDNDPTGNPGTLRWDDSGYTISVSGTVYAGEGSGGAPGVCDSTTPVVRLMVNGTTPYTATCTTGTGTFTFPSVSFSGDAVFTAYLNTGGTARAVTVTRTPSSNITGFDLYQNRIITRHEGVDPLTITQLAQFDRYDDTDVPFIATTTTNTLTVDSDNTLYIWSGKTFAPGGNVTLLGGASGLSHDGTLRLASSSVFTTSGNEFHSIGGNFIANSNAIFTAASSTVTFTATSSGKTLAPSSSFYNLTFGGTGGGWTIASSTTVANNLSVSAGTISGTANITVQNGSFSGNGVVSMTGGTATVQNGGSFGGSSAWSFSNLTLGDGTTNTTTKDGGGSVSIANVLTVSTSHTLDAGSATWTLTGAGSVLSVLGTLTPNSSTFVFAGTSGVSIPALTYYALQLAPANVGGPTYTLLAGSLSANILSVGNGIHPVTVTAITNDPLITVSDDVHIYSSATLSASDINDIQIGGSYLNEGTFTSNGGGVVFTSTDSGETITPGNSSFHHLTFDGVGGGWTFNNNATSTGNFTLTNATSFVKESGTTLVVQGAFTNGVGDSATEWTGTTLYLNSGTTYAMNAKSVGGDVYDTLRVGANTDVSMWNSSATTYTVANTGSLYSQDHAGVDGDLYIWGDYVRGSGDEYWSYATDFDGTDISATPRAVAVHLANGATTTVSGGSLEILGASTATTTITNQGTGTYALQVTGGTLNAQYYQIRDITSGGLMLSGTPTITNLSNGDYELAISGSSMITVAGTVIDANPVKLFANVTFATTSGVSSGYNVVATGSSVSSWRFIPGSGNYYGEAYDNDPGGNPGYIIFTDSDDNVTIAGNVYSDEGTTVSSICNGTNQVVALVINGGTPRTTSCLAGTGHYEFTNVTGYVLGDTITVFIDGVSQKGANITRDIITSIADMHLYENRVIVRHEETTPISVAPMSVYDSSDDSDVPFTVTAGSPSTLTMPVNTKLIVWSGKTFRPNGNVTLTSGGTGTAFDGTLELQSSASLIASSTVAETISVGGSWLTGTNATFTSGSSTVLFTATTTGKVVSPDASSFYNITFNGTGGSWTFADRDATSTNDVTISAGSVTFGTSSLAVGGSFVNNATMSAASTSIRFSSLQAENITFNGYAVGSIQFTGSGLHTMTDTNATSTGSVSITGGSVSLPSGSFSISDSFTAQGGTFTHAGTLRMYGSLAAQSLRFGSSTVRNMTIAGSGSWAFVDAYATTTGTTTIQSGALTAPSVLFSVGGSFINTGTFNSNAGHLYLFATTTGQQITASSSILSQVTLNGVGGGWTLTGSATSTGAWRLVQGASFTVASSSLLEVQGIFTNTIGGTATNWTDSTLYLNASGTSYTINTKTAGGDAYAYLTLGNNTDVRMWDSSGATTTVAASSSLYSMDHAGVGGDLYIWGEYVRTTGSDYWSYATDFDGVALGGSSRQVDVRIASSSTISLSNSTLQMVGSAEATTTVAVMNIGGYGLSLSGGTLNAQYYNIRNLSSEGIELSNSVTVTSLSYGDFELSVDTGTLISVDVDTIDQNPSKQFTNVRFGTGVATGTNVKLSGSSSNFWDFTLHFGGFDGEPYDSDGVDACGAVRWDDSTCLEVSQANYRFRSDDGGEGAPSNEWLDADWSYRKRITVSNSNSTTLTDYPVRIAVPYESEMLSTYNDLRFTDSSGTTTIPFYIESYTAATATVWVKIPSLPQNSSASVFVYYGNSFAANDEDGSATFTFFDDFEDNSLSEYSGDTSYFSPNTSYAFQKSYGLSASAGHVADQTPDGMYQTGTTFGQGSIIEFYQKITSGQDDEPCTLFGVQSPGSNNQNYALCLDQYPSDRIVLARNVSSNDSSGTTLASTSVTYTSQWYKVRIDWLTSNTIFATVYNANGTVFATTSASDSTYSSGGSGFAFWYQGSGWDFYTVRPYAANAPTYSFGAVQQGGGASWLAEQNTSVNMDSNTTFRVRMSVENSGPYITGQQYRLQYAPKTGYGTCGAVPDVSYNDIPVQSGCGVSPLCMATSPQYANADPTTQHLETTSGLAFTSGYMVEDPSNQGSSMTMATSTLTELEYALELTTFASDSSYCMRVSNGGVELDSYAQIPEVTVNGMPTITSWRLNNDEPIYLTEGEEMVIYATGTVSDVNGYEDLLYATTTIYRSGATGMCSKNDNNCYQVNSLDCPFMNCSGNSCDVECAVAIQYFADPTDTGSVYELEDWRADLFLLDMSNNIATSTSDGVDVQTLWALSAVTSDINYGTLNLGEDTGGFNVSSQVQNTGNSNIDIQVEGTDLMNGPSTIPAGNQLFSTTTFTYSECVICEALSGTATNLEVDLPKPTSTSTPITDDLYWGLYVPTGVNATTYYGQNTFYATGD